MPTPAREQVIQGVIARLKAISGMSQRVERDRVEEVSEIEAPWIVVYEGAHAPDTADEDGARAYWMTLDIELHEVGATLDACAQAFSALRASIEASLFAADALTALHCREIVANDQPPPTRLELKTQGPSKSGVASFSFSYAVLESDPFTFA